MLLQGITNWIIYISSSVSFSITVAVCISYKMEEHFNYPVYK